MDRKKSLEGDWNFIGLAIKLATVFFAFAAFVTGNAQTYSYVDIYDFASNNSGYNPYGPVTLGTGGNLYGTTYLGGGSNGCGTVFRISPTNGYSVLYNLPVTYWGVVDGAWYYPYGGFPVTGAVQDANGSVFVTTQIDPYGRGSNGSVIKIGPNGGGSQIMGFPGGNGGANPSAVTLDAYGYVYGTTNSGGASGVGTVFRLIPQVGGGYDYCKLFDFNGINGANPSQSATLALDSKGNLYGTTINGGANNLGTIFKISTSGIYTKLWDFNGANGSNPYGGVVLDAQGNLYGTTKFGGGGGGSFGTVYELSATGKFSTLIDFFQWGNGANGNNPSSNLIIDPQGNLYGTARSVFKIAPNGTYTNILGVSSYAGSAAALVIDSHGNLYGTTIAGGANGVGNVFELQASSMPTYSVSGQVTQNGVGLPNVNVSLGLGLSATTDSNGNFSIGSVLPGSYTLTPSLPNYTLAPASASVTVTNGNVSGLNFTATPTVYVYTDFFDFGNTVSQYPYGPVTLDGAGNLYGTTLGSTITNGPGTVFKLSPTAVYIDLYNLPITYWGVVDGAWYFPYGAYPITGVALDPNGHIFATTQVDPYTSDYGSVIKIGSGGGGTQIMGYSNTSRGANPSAVSLDPYGFVYGTNNTGGANSLGNVFRLIPQADGTYNFVDLHDFAGPDGSNPSQSATLAQDPSGNLYGTTITGGVYGLGTIFKVTTAGVYTKLWDFNGTNGANPYGGVVLDSTGNLFGTTKYGGAVLGNLGTVYKLSATGVFTTLVDFNLWGNGANGNNPTSNLVMDSQGNLYGTARSVFKINSDGTYVNLLGVSSYIGSGASLAIDGSGSLFGTTISGGTNGLGSVFRLGIGLKSLSLSPTIVFGGSSSTATVTLGSPASGGGTVVNLTSNSTYATVPNSITIPAGATSGTFVVNTSADASSATAKISASTGGNSISANLTINPPLVQGVTLTPATVTGGESTIGTVTLNGPAAMGGAVVTLSSNNIGITTPSTVTVLAGMSSAAFTVNTIPVSTVVTGKISASYVGSSQSGMITVNPPSIKSVSISPTSVIGGGTATGVVTINEPAPSGVISISLSSNTASATVPVTVLVYGGTASSSFKVKTLTVSTQTTATITATQGGVSQTATLTIYPVGLASVQISPNSVTGGSTSTGTVTLTNAAPTGGAVVNLTSSSSSATVPASVTVPAGALSATFTVNTTAVSSLTTSTITGTIGGTSQTANLTINPPVPMSIVLSPNPVFGGGSTTGTVTLNGPAPVGGIVVSLSSNNIGITFPTSMTGSVTVAAGSTTGTFTANTVVVSTVVTANVTATASGISVKTGITINPPLVLTGISLSPSTVYSPNSTVGTVTLNQPAGTGGATVMLSSNNVGITVPASVTVPAGMTSATFNVNTVYVSTVVTAKISATFASTILKVVITVNPPVALTSVSLSPDTVYGGNSTTGTVTLNEVAPPGGTIVNLSSNNIGITPPATVTVAGGTTSASFTVGTVSVTSVVTAKLAAVLALPTGTTPLKVGITVEPQPVLQSVTLSPNSLTGGVSATGTVTINEAALTGGVVIALSSNNVGIGVPASVTIPPGATTATFPVSTTPVASVVTAQIKGTLNAGIQRATITVNPPNLLSIAISPSTVTGGGVATGTVTLNGTAPSGVTTITLTSNDPSVTVPSTVIVYGGTTSSTFRISTHSVSAITTVTITGTLAGSSQTATITVNP